MQLALSTGWRSLSRRPNRAAVDGSQVRHANMKKFLRPVLTHVATLVAAAGIVTPACAQARPFTAEDMLDVVQISGSVAVGAKGDRLAFVLPDLSDEWNVAERVQVGAVHIMDVSSSGERPQPVAGAGSQNSYPVFSPDGTRLAFFMDSDKGGRLAILDIASGQVQEAGTPFPGKATRTPQWATVDRVVYARPDVPAPTPEQPRIEVLTISDPLPGDAYFRRDSRAGLRMADLRTGTERVLVPDGSRLGSFVVSPSGQYLLGNVGGQQRAQLWDLSAETDPHGVGAGADRPEWLADGRLLVRAPGRLAAIDPGRASGPPTHLVDLSLPIAGLTESPDGQHFAGFVADPSLTDPEVEAPQPNMYTVARPFLDAVLLSVPGGAITNLTEDISDQIRSLTWAPEGDAIYFIGTDNATYDETLYRYDVESGERTVLSTGKEAIDRIIATADGLLASIQSATTPSDLWSIDGTDGERARVTDLNPQLSDIDFSEPSLFHFESQEGDRLGSLLYRATGNVPPDGEPVITYVYEKLTPGIHRFQPRQQIFATHGYAVLMPNVMIRVGQPGTSYVSSVVPAIAAVRNMGFTNGKSCMWGGSFGAYATSFVITQTHTFDCAVSRATPPELFRNWASGRDRDSRNIESGQARLGGSPFEVQDRYISQSAFFHLDKVETPVLITHGVKDFTILYEEGAMMFYALRQLGKEATLVTYREGDHSLYRHSRADALDVHQRMLDWFALYLR